MKEENVNRFTDPYNYFFMQNIHAIHQWKSVKCRGWDDPARGGVLLHFVEEGGKTSSQYFIKYLSSLIMLKMYRKCTDAPFTSFLMIEMLKHCLA